MSIKSIENPNLAKDVSLASGTNSTQVKPWFGRIQFQLEKEAVREVLVAKLQALPVPRDG